MILIRTKNLKLTWKFLMNKVSTRKKVLFQKKDLEFAVLQRYAQEVCKES